MKIAAIVLIAGNSSRFKSSTPKQLFSLKGKPVFSYSLDAFLNNKKIDDVIAVVNKDNKKVIEEYNGRIKVVLGGKTRQESVFNGLNALNYGEDDIVIIHDSARPLIDDEVINSIIKAVKKYNAVSTSIKVEDTISKVSNNGFIDEFIDRNTLVKIQTPQAFNFNLIKKAHSQSKNLDATDDCTLVKQLGVKVKLIDGDKKLTKLTTIEDVKILESLLENE